MAKKVLMLVTLLALALALPAAAQDEETFALTIMHTNDTHAAHTPNGDGDGGVAIQRAVVNQIRAEAANSLLLDAGDRFTGTLFHQQYRGADQVQIMNLLGYEAIVLGNHEFDDGEDTLQAFAAGLEFPTLSANVDFSAYPEIDELVQPYIILEVGGEQIGVIGLTTPDTTITSSPADDVVFSDDLVGAAAAAVEELTAAGVNKIIALTHLGIDADFDVLEQMSGVDVVIGGHSHTLLSNTYASAAGDYPFEATTAAGEPILYVQAGANNLYLGRLDVEFDAAGVLAGWGGDTILLSRYISPDAEMSDLIAELEAPLEELRATQIGADAAFALDGDRTVCRIEECHIGNLMTDALLADTGADIAITNGGGIRANIDEGPITLGEVLTVFPFGNLTSTMDLTGADVIAALENGVSTVEVGADGVISRDGLNGRFPQVAGLRFSFDPTQEVGSRIVSVEVLNDAGEFEAIDEAATYTVATNDFMRNGGDGYEVFVTNAVNPYDFGKPLDQVLAEYLASLEIVEPEISGRITLVNAEIAPR
jgi:5'-nucleotidase